MMEKSTILQNYKPRIIDEKLDRYLKTFGAILIEGPRRCGKSWTGTFHSNSGYFMADSSMNFNSRKLAEMNPGIVLDGDTPRLIDEWQDVPPVWDAVRSEVDRRANPGQFILTGSASPKHVKTYHTGIGRIASIKMRTMSLFETGDSSGKISLKELCEGNLTPFYSDKAISLNDLAHYMIRGGWPMTYDNAEDASLVAADYVSQVIERDTQNANGTRYNKRKFELFMRSLARNESTLASLLTLQRDISDISGNDEKQSVDTIKEYLDFLDRMYLTENQPPYSPGIRSSIRVKQAEKRHFCDVSIACALLKATPQKLTGDLETFGLLFESLCEHDLRIYAEAFGGELYHYRDYADREIDAVIETPGGQWCAFEIKLGTNQIQSASDNLVKIKKRLENDGCTPPSVMCVISGLSQCAYRDENGVFVVPITALRP